MDAGGVLRACQSSNFRWRLRHLDFFTAPRLETSKPHILKSNSLATRIIRQHTCLFKRLSRQRVSRLTPPHLFPKPLCALNEVILPIATLTSVCELLVQATAPPSISSVRFDRSLHGTVENSF
jgi:hypothetical protein